MAIEIILFYGETENVHLSDKGCPKKCLSLIQGRLICQKTLESR